MLQNRNASAFKTQVLWSSHLCSDGERGSTQRKLKSNVRQHSPLNQLLKTIFKTFKNWVQNGLRMGYFVSHISGLLSCHCYESPSCWTLWVMLILKCLFFFLVQGHCSRHHGGRNPRCIWTQNKDAVFHPPVIKALVPREQGIAFISPPMGHGPLLSGLKNPILSCQLTHYGNKGLQIHHTKWS